MTRSNIFDGETKVVPELLAPAGDFASLRAAVCAGADAVYLGLGEFNARRNADNFTVESLARACEYAHLRGVSVYVTLNVAVLPSELARAVKCAADAYGAGADAFIVQDIGLAREIKRAVPGADLHVSTQMNTHSAAGIAAAAALGASRVTLARELSLPEIAELCQVAAEFGMEIECFAHGALCVCYSGQCLMSSMIGGRSANRGLCAQACRLPYDLCREGRDGALPAPGEHLLSPRDLCSVNLIAEMAGAGVASLKIEGRMKSPDYVHEVVSVYREVLDRGGAATPADEARLAEAFSRGFTEAYLVGQRGNDIMSYGRPNNRGVFVGRVAQVGDGVAEVAAEVALNAGDIVEFWTNKGHFSAPVPASALHKGRRNARIPVEHRVGKGDRVFRVRNAATAFVDDPFEPRVPIRGRAQLRIGEPLRICLEAGQGSGAVSVEVLGDAVEPARTRPVVEKDVADHIDRLGQTPFRLAQLDVELDEGVGIGFSQIHRLRADAVEALKRAMLAPYEKDAADPALIGAADSPIVHGLRGNRAKAACDVVAWVTNPSCARVARRCGVDGIYVPLVNFKRGQSALAGVRQTEAEQAGYPKQCVMALPAIEHDPVAGFASGETMWAGTREHSASFDFWDYVREGRPVFADSLASVVRALELGARVEVGPHVPLTNAASIRAMADMGASRVWLSPELTLGQIAELADQSPMPLGLTVLGAQELMITEHCLLMSQGPCGEECETCPRRSAAHKLVDRKGFEFPVITDMFGRSHLYNGIELDAVPMLSDLLDIGITAVMVDTTLLDKKSASEAIGRAVRARDLAIAEHRSVAKRRNTTTGHLFRGVS